MKAKFDAVVAKVREKWAGLSVFEKSIAAFGLFVFVLVVLS